MHAYYVIIYVIHDYICYVFMYIYIYIYIHIFVVMGHAWLVGKGVDSATP